MNEDLEFFLMQWKGIQAQVQIYKKPGGELMYEVRVPYLVDGVVASFVGINTDFRVAMQIAYASYRREVMNAPQGISLT